MSSLRISRTISGGGLTLEGAVTRSPDGVQAYGPIALGLGKTGTLTTRTDANTGVATLTGGHGITTGQVVDIYWATGMRYGVTVGTVSVNSVPFDLGAGDDLPSTSTALVFAPRVEVSVSINSLTAAVIAAQAGRDDANSLAKAHLEFALADDSTNGHWGLEGNLPRVVDLTAYGSQGFSEDVPTGSPATASIFASNGSSTETATLQILVGQDATP